MFGFPQKRPGDLASQRVGAIQALAAGVSRAAGQLPGSGAEGQRQPAQRRHQPATLAALVPFGLPH